MKGKINLKLNKLQWTLLKSLCEDVLENSPIEDWQIESCVICDCYKRHLQKFTFWPHGNNPKLNFSLSYAEAFAINNYFAANNTGYNVLIRQILEPKLPTCKS